MAAGMLPKPGSQHGPCVEPCKHTDCALTRQMAATPCGICGDAITYDRPFYDERDGAARGLVHAMCLELEIADQQQGRV